MATIDDARFDGAALSLIPNIEVCKLSVDILSAEGKARAAN
jgi:hypothetical protein